MFRKRLLIYINSKVPFDESLPPLPSRRSGVPDSVTEKESHIRQMSVIESFVRAGSTSTQT